MRHDVDIVVRVAIILDEGAARVVHVAGKLHGVRVDLVHGGKECLTLMHNNCVVLVVSGGSELRVIIGVNVDIATDQGKVNTMGVHDGAVSVVNGRLLVVGVLVVGVLVVVIVVMIVVVGVWEVVRVLNVVVLIVMGLIRDEVVVRVAIIGDQGAAIDISIDVHVAGDLNLVSIDLVVVNNVSVAVNLDHRLSWGDSGGGQLSVGVRGGVDVASGVVELNSVGVCDVMVVVVLVVVMVMMMVGVRIGLVVLVVIMMSVLVSTEVVMGVPACVRLVDVATVECIAVVQLSATAGENAGACGNHLGSESKLLAVKNQGVLVVIKIVLRVLAVLAQVVNSLPNGAEVVDESFHVVVSFFMVKADSMVLVAKCGRKNVDVVGDARDATLEGLEGNEKLSLNLDSLFVVVLVPDFVVVIELPNLSVEVSSGKFFATVHDVVIGVLVAGVGVVVVALGVDSTVDVVTGGVSGRSVNLGLRRDFGALDESDRSEKRNRVFHLLKYILKFDSKFADKAKFLSDTVRIQTVFSI